MKHLVLATLLILAGNSAHAIAADRFSCKTQIKNMTGHQLAEQNQEFSVPRIPTNSPVPGDTSYTMTSGNSFSGLEFRDAGGKFVTTLNFYYSHALRSQNGSNEGFQQTCIGFAGGYCPDEGDYNLCAMYTVACAQKIEPIDPANPNDPVKGWMKTAVLGGLPVFNERALSPRVVILEDKGKKYGTAEVNCKFLGTFN